MQAGLLSSPDSHSIVIELQINNGYSACGTAVHIPYDQRLQQLGIRDYELTELSDDLTDHIVELKQQGDGRCWFGCTRSTDPAAVADLIDLLMQCAVARWQEQGINAEYIAPHDPSGRPANLCFHGTSLKRTPHLPSWDVAPCLLPVPAPLALSSPIGCVPPSAPVNLNICAVLPSAPPLDGPSHYNPAATPSAPPLDEPAFSPA